MTEPREIREKRLYMRSIRRGIKEMDLILTAYAGRNLPGMSSADLDLYEDLLSENDHDLYAWVTGQTPAPERYGAMIESVAKALQNEENQALRDV